MRSERVQLVKVPGVDNPAYAFTTYPDQTIMNKDLAAMNLEFRERRQKQLRQLHLQTHQNADYRQTEKRAFRGERLSTSVFSFQLWMALSFQLSNMVSQC